MIYGILLAAGNSQRFGNDKLQLKLKNKPIWQWSLEILTEHKFIDKVIFVGPKSFHLPNSVTSVSGGNTRFESLSAAFNYLERVLQPSDLIVVHNAANPLASKKEVSKVIRSAKKIGAAAVGGPVYETIKKVSKDDRILNTIDRSTLRAMQTPQALRADILIKGLKNLNASNLISDEMMIAEVAGIKPFFIPKSENNFKITTQDDYLLARIKLKDLPMAYAVGVGLDSHKFKEKEKGSFLGGVFFKNIPAFSANSDGDVILHALCNALLSAVGEGSFSSYADELCQQGIKDSKEYLDVALEVIDSKGFKISNVSIALECKTPNIDSITPELKKSLQFLLQIEEDKIGITSTSGEGLSDFGKGLGVSCQAIVSLVQ